jgi:hypothetical protein
MFMDYYFYGDDVKHDVKHDESIGNVKKEVNEDMENLHTERKKILVEVASGNILTIENGYIPFAIYDLTQLKKYKSRDNKIAMEDPVFSFSEFIPKFTELGLQNMTKPRFPIFEDYVNLSFRRTLSMKDFLGKYSEEKKRYAALTALGIFFEKFNDMFIFNEINNLAEKYLNVCKRNVHLHREYYSDMVTIDDDSYSYINDIVKTTYMSIDRLDYDNFAQVVLFQKIDKDIARFLGEFVDPDTLISFLNGKGFQKSIKNKCSKSKDGMKRLSKPIGLHEVTVDSNLSVAALDATILVSSEIHKWIQQASYANYYAKKEYMTTEEERIYNNAQKIYRKLMKLHDKQMKEGIEFPKLAYHLLTEVGLTRKDGFVTNLGGGCMASFSSKKSKC